MAQRAQPIRPIHFIVGGSTFGFLLLLTLGTTLAVWSKAEFAGNPDPADWAAIRFTLRQSFVSAFLSVLFAIPLARAIARRRFRGRALLVSLLGAPFLLPAIVAVLGILAIWGRAGLVSDLLAPLGYGPLNIYGFNGVVLAHVFFNLPLATRIILQGWTSIPSEHFRASAQLNFSQFDIFRHLEWPMLRHLVPAAFLLVLLLCISSFAVALALGGGPKATTVELAIYQALRFDFDLSNAAYLAIIQFGLTTAFAVVTLILTRPEDFATGLDRVVERFDGKSTATRIIDNLFLIGAALFLFLPLASIVLKGVFALPRLPAATMGAMVTTILVALASTVICICFTLALSMFITRIARKQKRSSQAIEIVGFLTLAASPFVMGTGLFILINPYFDPFSLALPLTALVNAAMALPFALRIVLPALWRAEANYGPLADSLGMETWAKFRLSTWPRLRRPLGFAAGLSAALSAGDLGVIALFAAPEVQTLPLLMYRLMANYQLEAANGVALILVATSFCLFWAFDKGGQLDHRVR